MHATEHLEQRKWQHPEHYGGFSPDGDYLIAARNRDSSILEGSNYERIMADLEAHAATLGEAPDVDRPGGDMPYVYDWRARHWACGWVEYLMIRQDAPDSLKALAGEIICALEGYPVYDEEDYSERQEAARWDYWQQASISERMEWCREAGVTVLAARHDDYSRHEALAARLYDSDMFA